MTNHDPSVARITPDDLTQLNATLERLPSLELIKWSHSRFGKRLGVLSAMQKAGCALCQMVAELGLQDDIEIVFVDTGVNYWETLDTIERVKKEYGLKVLSLHPEFTMAEQILREGILYLDPEGQKKCCNLRKKAPLKQIMGRYDALLSSLRRGSGGNRAEIPVLALDTELNLIRIHPLLNMNNDDLEKYIEEKDVIINPLHAQGYPTVSCNRCTTPVLPGEPERAGRWRHLENAAVYCNINPTDRARVGDNSDFVELGVDVVGRILDFQI
ncbi:MAG: phosphoadenylyl-sulfate reductase [Candidatus Sumerlaeia bacterium]|nr:phosphoadenylyl-sulfate reductase [Candidatus Sumerlaeia bacterium]